MNGTADPQPNFLLFITDQQRADHLGCMGDPLLRTPHIDALAAQGTVFDRFFVNTPVCMPNRAALLTGRMPGAAGVRMNGVPLPLGSRTYAQALHEAGYRTALIGKAHLQNMTRATPTPVAGEPLIPRDRQGVHALHDGAGYDREWPERWAGARAPPESGTPYYGFAHTELCLEHGDRVGGNYAHWLRAQAPELDRERWQPDAQARDCAAAPQSWRTVLPPELYPTHYVADRAEAWLRAHAATPADRRAPFLLHCSFPDPHHPLTPPGRYRGLYRPQDVTLPASFDAPMALAPPHKRALHDELRAGRRNLQGSRAIAVQADEARSAIALNYGAIAMVDDAVGRVLATLRALDLERDTVVVFLSDHGDFMGDHGLLFKGPLHYRSVLRMPFIWRDTADRRPAPSRHSGLARAIDLAPTLLERAGVSGWHGLQGRSLRPWAGEQTLATDAVLVEEQGHHRLPGLPWPALVRSLVTARWRLSVYPGADWGEMYDLQDDPHEVHNRFGDAAFANERAELLWRLTQEMALLGPDLPLPMRTA